MKPESPCLNCAHRCVLCHSTCEKYIGFRADLELFTTEQHKEDSFVNYIVDQQKRTSKKHKK